MPADPFPKWALVALAVTVAAAVLGLALYGMGFRGMSDVLLRDMGRPLMPPLWSGNAVGFGMPTPVRLA
ncbi:hypothetical protein [Siccirubricoccus sp. G192]|uniref:hypothetical protein n=1 Tax=Siccirubricoccus sp. G192 TaxID=2849651 RepID=UPI001C2CC29E|nr:hypothetical protein [Siccirubricoccus sp. G192]MBV1798916.1 hypothetical protein [Siccirubricoccus sp. G192]